MKKCIALVLSLLLIFSMVGCSDNSSETERQLVNGTAAATFEYVEDIDKGHKVITSEVSSLYTFDDLDLIPSDDNSTFDWIYRIVFNPAEIVKDGKEITVITPYIKQKVFSNREHFTITDTIILLPKL